ncbi:MAG: FAD-dependent oxidoreductase [bacterium]
MTTNEMVVVGGGMAGLVAAVTAAEAGAPVRLLEKNAHLGGRARSTPEPFVANEGPHVLYADGALWRWLLRRDLARPYRRLPMGAAAGIRFRRDGRLRAMPSAGLMRLMARRGRTAPVDVDFRSWVTSILGEATAAAASSFMGVATFTSDPGRLSAAFVWERLLRVSNPGGGPRYLVGGWSALVDRLADHAHDLGVRIETGSPVTTLPTGPTIVATSLPAARNLLGRPLSTPAVSGDTVLLDVAVHRRRGDAFIVSDLDRPGWVEAFSRADPALTPKGSTLVQAQRPIGEEGRPDARRQLEDLVDLGLPGWRERTVWRRDGSAHHRTGALDLPGYTWRDRPAVDQGDGVFLAGDEVGAPGLLSEVSFASATAAATGAVEAAKSRRLRVDAANPAVI